MALANWDAICICRVSSAESSPWQSQVNKNHIIAAIKIRQSLLGYQMNV